MAPVVGDDRVVLGDRMCCGEAQIHVPVRDGTQRLIEAAGSEQRLATIHYSTRYADNVADQEVEQGIDPRPPDDQRSVGVPLEVHVLLSAPDEGGVRVGGAAGEAGGKGAGAQGVVGVQEYEERADAGHKTRVAGGREPTVLAAQQANARIAHGGHGRRDVVRRAVVDDDDLRRRRLLREATAQGIAQEVRLLVAGDDHGDRGGVGHGVISRSPTVLVLPSSRSSPRSSGVVAEKPKSS